MTPKWKVRIRTEKGKTKERKSTSGRQEIERKMKFGEED